MHMRSSLIILAFLLCLAVFSPAVAPPAGATPGVCKTDEEDVNDTSEWHSEQCGVTLYDGGVCIGYQHAGYHDKDTGAEHGTATSCAYKIGGS